MAQSTLIPMRYINNNSRNQVYIPFFLSEYKPFLRMFYLLQYTNILNMRQIHMKGTC